RKIRFHERFQPKGTNADFVQVIGKNEISKRVYERGVEDETLASGTGTLASAIIAYLKKGVGPPTEVEVRSGSKLSVDFDYRDGKITNTQLTGPARLVYEGKYFL
ncbi:MAG: diaminopimelate epimerase, partial [Thermoplasmata archaeon]|nr:diaminopimelate epimerase [Thermoplasmata archaeon]